MRAAKIASSIPDDFSSRPTAQARSILRANITTSLPQCFSAVFCRLVFCLCIALACGEFALAQQATAVLTGAVKDASGAIVVGAKITLRDAQTNSSRNTTTGKDGDYVFNLVPIGAYEVTVEHAGFEKYVRKGITLEINQNARLDVSLQIGMDSPVVEVTGDVTQDDTVSATLGTVETTARLQEL